MRRHIANDRLIANELIASAVDGPENATFVRSGCQLSVSAALEVTAASGTVTITGSDVSASEQSETVTDISGQTTNTAYRYHTFSVDDTGTLQIQSSNIGDFDADAPDQPPTTQVTEPRHPEGNVYLGVAFQVADQIEQIFDGRYIKTQGAGSAIDADTLRGQTAENLMPQQSIIMWSGNTSNVPDGWTLADGNDPRQGSDSVPDLRNRFITGAGDEYSVGDVGGEKEYQLTEAELASHNHGYESYVSNNVTDDVNSITSTAGGYAENDKVSRTTNNTGGNEAHENRPRFYALAYLYKL